MKGVCRYDQNHHFRIPGTGCQTEASKVWVAHADVFEQETDRTGGVLKAVYGRDHDRRHTRDRKDQKALTVFSEVFQCIFGVHL